MNKYIIRVNEDYKVKSIACRSLQEAKKKLEQLVEKFVSKDFYVLDEQKYDRFLIYEDQERRFVSMEIQCIPM